MIDNVFDFEKELHLMNEDELRSLLRTLYLIAEREVSVQSVEENSVHFATKIQSIFNTLDENRNREKAEKQALMAQNPREIHIAIGESPLGSIKVAMGKVPGRSERRFFSMNDYYAIGPLGDMTNKADLHRRHLWLLEKFYWNEHGSYAVQGMNELLQVNNMLSSIDEDTRITIWYANNAHERTGLLYAMHLLRNRLGPIYLIETSALYQELFHNSEVQHDVLRTGEIFWRSC